MFENLIQLVILFLVIFDPLLSLMVFLSASKKMIPKERRTNAILAVLVAFVLSFSIVLIGGYLLVLFNTTLGEFKIAGGIILIVLGIKMALGIPLADQKILKSSSGRAIAAIIGTPLLTGPAAMTAIIVSVNDYGYLLTVTSITIVLGLTALIFLQAEKINRIIGKTMTQVLSTIFGLITLSWGIKLIKEGIFSII